jgi:hypothetical protein
MSNLNYLRADLQRLQACHDFMARYRDNLGKCDEALGHIQSIRADTGDSDAEWQRFGARHTYAPMTLNSS